MKYPTREEILMLSYANKYTASTDVFQKFWEYKYHSEPRELLNHLYIENYIDVDKNAKYCLTSSGKQVLEDNPNIIFIHKHTMFDLSIYDVPPSGDIYEFIERCIDKEEAEHIYYCQWGLFRNCKSKRASLCKLQSDFMGELKYLFQVCYIDISGLRNGVKAEKIEEIREYIINADDPRKGIAGGNIERIRKISKQLNLNNDDLNKICKQVVINATLPYHLYSDDEAALIIMQRYNDTYHVSLPQ